MDQLKLFANPLHDDQLIWLALLANYHKFNTSNFIFSLHISQDWNKLSMLLQNAITNK